MVQNRALLPGRGGGEGFGVDLFALPQSPRCGNYPAKRTARMKGCGGCCPNLVQCPVCAGMHWERRSGEAFAAVLWSS